MWFEILPSFGIITAVLSVPGFALYGLHKLTLDNVSVELGTISNGVYVIAFKCLSFVLNPREYV